MFSPSQSSQSSHSDPSDDLRRHRNRAQRALTLLDLIMALAILGLMAYLSVPPLRQMNESMELRLAAQEVAGIFQQSRQYAVTHNVHVGVKFTTDEEGRVSMSLYRDGDGDGVRTKDIESGDDPPEISQQPLRHVGQVVRFGFPDGPMPHNIGGGRGRIARREDPIRFNRSDIASFGPMGTATPGTVYLTDGRRRVAAIRVVSRNARILVYHWDQRTGLWR